MTEQECIERGGHFWNHYDNATPVDEFGRANTNSMYCIMPTQNFRKCGMCLRTEMKVPQTWVLHEPPKQNKGDTE